MYSFGPLGYLIQAWHGLAWPGMAWHGLAWPGMAWPGMAWPGMAWLSLCKMHSFLSGHSRGSVGIVTVKNLTVEDLPPGERLLCR